MFDCGEVWSYELCKKLKLWLWGSHQKNVRLCQIRTSCNKWFIRNGKVYVAFFQLFHFYRKKVTNCDASACHFYQKWTINMTYRVPRSGEICEIKLNSLLNYRLSTAQHLAWNVVPTGTFWNDQDQNWQLVH